MSQKLGLGEYFGESIRRRQSLEFTITENHFTGAMHIPQHEHVLSHITCLISGQFIETYPGKVLTCVPGSLLIVPAGQAHSDEIGPEGAHTLSVEFSPDFHKRLGGAVEVLEMATVLNDPTTCRLIERIYAEFRTSDPASLLALASLTLSLLTHAERTLRKEYQAEPEWMRRIMGLLHDSPEQTFSLSKIAAEVGVHEAHLARTFRKIHGCSVGEYARWLKLEEAKKRLGATDALIAEIAVDLGFYDQAHFSREFVKAYGIAPSKYRRLMK
ncbi:MAG: helix-turn-helix transcriptional regulator [Fimbriimonadaceae bacterium]|nr:helix-turn-helix transcriptional regulator [Fimbriimonadaceae bacterium]